MHNHQAYAFAMFCPSAVVQYISKLLKGEENLSLETICKLEDALNIAILQYEFA